jgi:ElaB/YqjD/DUF883 family membrane-anchored ribosome-binding protein
MGQSPDSLEPRPRRRVVYTSGPPSKHEERSQQPEVERENRDVAELRVDIAHTRADMAATIDAIQYKLEPERIKQQVRATVRGATIGKAEQVLDSTRDAGNSMLDRVRENPIPAAMIAIGLGWLLTRQSTRRGYDYGADEYRTDSHSNVRQQVRESADDMRERAGEMRDRVGGRTAEIRDRAGYQAQRARGTLEQLIDDNPLGLGAVAVAVGAAVGLAAPTTSRENELMGEARDGLMDRAQVSAEEAMAKAKRVAANLAEEVREETSQQF